MTQTIGERIKVLETIRAKVEELTKETAAARMAQDYHARRAFEVTCELWKIVGAAMPEVDLKRYNYSIDHQSLDIVCTGPLKQPLPPAANDKAAPEQPAG